METKRRRCSRLRLGLVLAASLDLAGCSPSNPNDTGVYKEGPPPANAPKSQAEFYKSQQVSKPAKKARQPRR